MLLQTIWPCIHETSDRFEGPLGSSVTRRSGGLQRAGPSDTWLMPCGNEGRRVGTRGYFIDIYMQHRLSLSYMYSVQ